MRDWLNSLDYKCRLVYKGRLARGFFYLLKANALALLLTIAHCSKVTQSQGRAAQSVNLQGSNQATPYTQGLCLTEREKASRGERQLTAIRTALGEHQ